MSCVADFHRRSIRKRYQYPDARVHQHCLDLETAARLITDLPKVRVVERDPNDDMIIACALKAQADYIVTRDKDLLSVGAHEGIRMVTPRQFLDLHEGSCAG